MTSLMCAFRPLLRPNSRIFSAISRRILTRNFASCGKTDFFDVNQYSESCLEPFPPSRGGKLEVNYLIGKITNWLRCSPDEAKNILAKTPSLRQCHLDLVYHYIQFMKQKNFDMKLVVQNPWLLDYSLSTMRERITLLSMVVEISQDTIHLLQFTTNNLARAVKQWMYDEKRGRYDRNGNRLEFFSKQLNCSMEELTIRLKAHSTLLTYDLDRVMAMYSILIDHGITPNDIFMNLDIFSYSIPFVRDSLEAMSLSNGTVKLYSIKCGRKKLIKATEKTAKDIVDIIRV